MATRATWPAAAGQRAAHPSVSQSGCCRGVSARQCCCWRAICFTLYIIFGHATHPLCQWPPLPKRKLGRRLLGGHAKRETRDVAAALARQRMPKPRQQKGTSAAATVGPAQHPASTRDARTKNDKRPAAASAPNAGRGGAARGPASSHTTRLPPRHRQAHTHLPTRIPNYLHTCLPSSLPMAAGASAPSSLCASRAPCRAGPGCEPNSHHTTRAAPAETRAAAPSANDAAQQVASACLLSSSNHYSYLSRNPTEPPWHAAFPHPSRNRRRLSLLAQPHVPMPHTR